MKYLTICVLLTLATGLRVSKKFDVQLHQEYLHVEKDKSMYIEHKSLDSMFKIGREGSNKCLAFMHIPKNAGSAVERLGKHYVRSTDPSARHWGMFDHSLACDTGHSCTFKYGNNQTATCPKWHVPPHLDAKLAASYTRDGCQTFCIVRSPSEKFFSELKFYYQNDGRTEEGLNFQCSKEWFHDAAELSSSRTREKPYWNKCHFVPQSEFVYGKDADKDFFKQTYCDHQLRMENLEEDFGNLMKKFDIPLALNKHLQAQGSTNEKCDLSEEERDADKTAHSFIMDWYSSDLKNFGYSK